ncbi:translation initiation factor 5 [Nematocida minor]|uniref:translation initiation factor 5 n=1 Tax=Nematocida minor TaxID=1912983 RepID=UPI00221EAA3B|nr:translation initiation factor 5 [Nematocida minor]KAI5189626.1 translation initiation factor 5 [Nematocida minor]
MKTINIDRNSQDAFYRYKMPEVETKIEGRGNGIKTVLVNIEEISRSLDREPKHLTKYLSYELGTLSSIDDANSKYIINGAHDKEKVQAHIFRFIEEFVLCKSCERNPETVLFTDSHRKHIQQRCKACGKVNTVKTQNKMGKILLKELPDKAEANRLEPKEFDDIDDFEVDYAFGK